MATLKDYFDTDHGDMLGVNQQLTISNEQNVTIDVPTIMHIDVESHAKHFSFFIADSENTLYICFSILQNLTNILALYDGIQVEYGYLTDIRKNNTQITFTRQITLYVDQTLDNDLKTAIHRLGEKENVFIQIRDRNYMMAKTQIQHPVAFISHDSRDKHDIARPLAIALAKRMQIVWYDEFTLKIGDRLRESIENGLKQCNKCVMILSKNFLSNTGWTKAEFDSIFTREIIQKCNIILPIWVDVTSNDVYEYCPSLADRVAICWDKNIDKVADELTTVMRT